MANSDVATRIEKLAEAVRKEAWLASRAGQMDRLADIAELMDAVASDVKRGGGD